MCSYFNPTIYLFDIALVAEKDEGVEETVSGPKFQFVNKRVWDNWKSNTVNVRKLNVRKPNNAENQTHAGLDFRQKLSSENWTKLFGFRILR